MIFKKHGEAAAPSGKESHEKKDGKPTKRFLLVYVFALLFIALGLVLLSYFSQIRAAKEQIADLTEEHKLFSVSALDSIDKLKAENDRLNEELDKYEAESSRLSSEKQELESENSELSSQLGDAQSAKDALLSEKLTLEFALACVADADETVRLCSGGEYAAAAELVKKLRANGGEAEIEKYESLNLDYQSAAKKLDKRGYLD